MSKPLILMLEYDEDDQYLSQQHFKEFYPYINLKIVSSSEEFMAYLKGLDGPGSKPDLFLLNYYSTPKSAPELLRWIRGNSDFRSVPAVVLSGTIIPGIVKECYESGASSFIQKPSSMEDTAKKIDAFVQYWFQTVVLV